MLALAGLVVLATCTTLVFGEQLLAAAGGATGLPLRAEADLKAAIESAFERAEGDDVVVLADVTDFAWDAVGVFHDYYPRERVLEEMGIRVPRGVTNNTVLEGNCLLVFRRGNRMVEWTSVSAYVAECWPHDRSGSGVYTPHEARFGADSFEPVATAGD